VRFPQFNIGSTEFITIVAGAVGGAAAIALMEVLAERTTVRCCSCRSLPRSYW
jgi:hypothetical protein